MGSRIPWLIFAIAALASVLFIGLSGRGVAVDSVAWEYFHRLTTQPLTEALFEAPPDKYLIAVPLLAVYAPLAEIFGIESYLPFRLVGIVLIVLAAALLMEFARRRAGYGFALPAAVLLLFFGAAGEVVAVPQRIPGLMGVCFGLGMLLALDREDKRGDVGASILGVFGIASHPVMLPFLAGAGVRVLFGTPPRRLKRFALILGPALTTFLLWRVFLLEETPAEATLGLTGILEFGWDQLVAVLAALTGFFRGPNVDGIDFANPLAVTAALFLVAAVAYVIARRRWTLGLVAALVILVVALTTPVIGQTAAFRSPSAERYLYPGAVIVLLVIAELVRAGRPWPNTFRYAAIAGAVVWVGAAMPSNIAQLDAEANAAARTGDYLRAELAALELARDVPGSAAEAAAAADAAPGAVTSLTFHGDAPPEELAAAIIGGASAYFDIASEYGTPAWSLDELTEAPDELRTQADRVLVQVLPVDGLAAEGAPPAGAEDAQPLPIGEPDIGAGTCARVVFAPESLPDPVIPPPPEAAPPLASVTVPPGTAWIDWGEQTGVGVRAGLFGDSATQTVALADASQVDLTLADVGDEQSLWKLTLYAEDEATVCAE